MFFTEFCLYNKQKNTWVLGNTRFISRVEHDIMFNTRIKSGISALPCIILYIFLCINALSGTAAGNRVTARAVFDAGHISGDIQQIFSQYSRLVFPALLYLR